MVKPIDLSVAQENRADGTRRTISLRNAGSSGADSLEIHIDLIGEVDVPAPDVLDGFVIGVIFHAMASGRPCSSVSSSPIWGALPMPLPACSAATIRR